MSRWGWRIAMVAFLPGASVVLGVFWLPWGLPESPKWLCSQGKLKEASEAVLKFGQPSARHSAVDDDEMGPNGTGSQRPPESDMAQSFYIQVVLSILCLASAAMLIKVWLPQVLAQRGVHNSTMAFVTMWAVEATALLCSGLIFGGPARKRGATSNVALLRVSQGSFLIAGCSVLGYFWASSAWLITVLGVAHLLGQSNASNFLIAYATLSFPVAVRARCVAGIFLATYAGYFVGPLIGVILLQSASTAIGAYSVLSTGAVIYAMGFLASVGLERRV